MRCLIVALCLCVLSPASLIFGREVVTEQSNNSVALTLYDDGGLRLTHTRTGVAWNSYRPADMDVTLSNIRDLTWTIQWDSKNWRISAELLDDGLRVTVVGSDDQPMGHDFPYPYAFVAPDPDYEMAIPSSEGFLLNVADAVNEKVLGNYICYSWAGLAMPWFGVTNFNGGMAALIETPDDAQMNLQIYGDGNRYVWKPQPEWRPSKFAARYPRAIQYHLFADGDYVDMAKWYRRHAIKTGLHVTLREKLKQTPALEKLIGALDIYPKGSDESVHEMISFLRDKGVKKMLINTEVDRQYTDQFKEWGYLLGQYKIYTDMAAPDSMGGKRGNPAYDDGFPDDAYTMFNNAPVRGFLGRGSYRCSLKQLPLMQRIVPGFLASRGYEAFFIDVVTANGFYECYSWNHPLTRTQDKYARKANLQYIMDQGVVTSSEDVKDYAVPNLHYFEGLVTQVRVNQSPHIFASDTKATMTPTEDFTQYNLNERVRIPLWELVYHDAVVSTWRWNITPDRYLTPGTWLQNDLILAINGSMPIYVVSQKTLLERQDGILRSYEMICKLNEKTGWDEMVDHNNLTPDRSVQESLYANGVGVIVNFSEADYRHPKGGLVPAKDVRSYQWK